MRSTILSTRSSARSGRTRKIVSYSRSRVPFACCGAPPVVCVSVCCMAFLSGKAPGRCRERGSLLLQSAVVLVRRRLRPFHQRRNRRLCGERDQFLQLRLLVRRELRQHPIGPFPLSRRPAHPESHPHRLAGAEMFPDAAQPIASSLASALLPPGPP